MTVSEQHPVNGEKMLEIIKKTNMRKLYFVVPKKTYEDFKLQRVDYKTQTLQENNGHHNRYYENVREVGLSRFLVQVNQSVILDPRTTC